MIPKDSYTLSLIWAIVFLAGSAKTYAGLHPAVETSVKPAAWAAMNRRDAVRKESSSGGVFSLLAESVIQNGGVVFGAAFNECFDVEHIAVETMEDLARCVAPNTRRAVSEPFSSKSDTISRLAGRCCSAGRPVRLRACEFFLGRTTPIFCL